MEYILKVIIISIIFYLVPTPNYGHSSDNYNDSICKFQELEIKNPAIFSMLDKSLCYAEKYFSSRKSRKNLGYVPKDYVCLIKTFFQGDTFKLDIQIFESLNSDTLILQELKESIYGGFYYNGILFLIKKSIGVKDGSNLFISRNFRYSDRTIDYVNSFKFESGIYVFGYMVNNGFNIESVSATRPLFIKYNKCEK